MNCLIGYDLVEDSFGKNKSGTYISKWGRKKLQSVLYQIVLTVIANNKKLCQLYDCLKIRKNNPLEKVFTLIFTLSKKKVYYELELVFGSYRKSS